jgi:hypothetical protein
MKSHRLFDLRLNPSRLLLTAIIASCTLLASCAAEKQQWHLAVNAVDLFHSQLDSQQYTLMYQAADAGMKDGMQELDFVNLLQNVHQTLGQVQSSALKGTVFQTAQGTIRLDYDTTFARGSAREQFVWKVEQDHATLRGYKINSKQLASK